MGDRRQSYSFRFKKDAILTLDRNNGNVAKTSRECKVSRQNIIRWRNEREEILKQNESSSQEQEATTSQKLARKQLARRKRKRKAAFPLMEYELLKYIKEVRSQGIAIHRQAVKLKAKELMPKFYPTIKNFNASSGWCTRFLQRNNLSHRAVTSVGQKVPDDAAEKVKQYFKTLEPLLKQVKKEGGDVGHMDEVPMYFDMPSSRTIDFTGIKTVRTRTTGKEKLRFSVALTILSSGKKLRPLIIFKNLKKVPKGNFPKDVVITVAKGGSMTNGIMTQTFIPEVWNQRPANLFRKRFLLVLDSHKSHFESKVKTSLSRNKTDTLKIEGGMTPVLSPLDTHTNRSVKSMMRKKWEDWFSDGEVVLTKSGNRKRASYGMVATWVSESWKTIEADSVLKAMAENGLTFDANPRLHSKLAQLVADTTVTGDKEWSIDDDADSEDEESHDETVTDDERDFNDDVLINDLMNESSASDMSESDVEENGGSGKEIDSTRFKKFLVENKDEIITFMRAVQMPKSNNPFASMNENREMVLLMKYENACETMMTFTTEDPDFRALQASTCLILQNARFEQAYVKFLKLYLAVQDNNVGTDTETEEEESEQRYARGQMC